MTTDATPEQRQALQSGRRIRDAKNEVAAADKALSDWVDAHPGTPFDGPPDQRVPKEMLARLQAAQTALSKSVADYQANFKGTDLSLADGDGDIVARSPGGSGAIAAASNAQWLDSPHHSGESLTSTGDEGFLLGPVFGAVEAATSLASEAGSAIAGVLSDTVLPAARAFTLNLGIEAAALSSESGLGSMGSGPLGSFSSASIKPVGNAAAEGEALSLNILNRNFEPDPVAIMQNHVDAANASLTADPTLARSFLSPAEYAQFQTPGGYALNYGKAIENSVAKDIAENPLSDSLFDHVGGPNEPDFVGRANTIADPFQFDITTPAQVTAHFARPYGPDTYMLTYQRP